MFVTVNINLLLLFCFFTVIDAGTLHRVVSYLLVAILPGEVQEAGGEQLIFGPGITVHGVFVFVPAVSVAGVCGVLPLQTEILSFKYVFPRRVSLSLSVCVPRLLLRPAPWKISNEQQRRAVCCFSLSRGLPLLPPQKNKSGMSVESRCGSQSEHRFKSVSIMMRST